MAARCFKLFLFVLTLLAVALAGRRNHLQSEIKLVTCATT